ncbi:MAG: right-handed parallel beta-helix repeat-containing protein, partial [Candidatus Methanoperedens sp.]|nr:right-handed parallel beta-helix repeat-containing protein [Candidatus Methanoperedens sp.]
MSIIFAILAILIASVLPVSAGINFNYTNVVPRNYTITDSVLNSNNFVRLTGGDIEMPSITLRFAINRTLVSGNKSLILKSSIFGPKTTSLPNQKVFYINPGGTATADYSVDASNTFANMVVNVSTYKQVSGSVPFFSDHSTTLLNNIDDLKNLWNNNSKVLDEFLSIVDDVSRINETTVTLDSNGDSGQLSQNLAPGRYLIMVTNGTDPKKIIAWNVIIVIPFSSSIIIGDGTGNATQGTDLIVNVSLNSTAPAENYTYTTTIINRGDYADNLGNINITWGPGQTLAQATSINGIILNSANALTDIIPLSNTTKITTNSKSVNMTLKTGALSSGSYLVNTLVFNSTNFSVVFNQSLLTLTTGGDGGGGGGGATQMDACGNISEPGKYVLNMSITDSSAADACIRITSNDVVFDGAGYTIDGVDTPFNDGIAVHFNDSVALTNVTVKNVTLTDWDYGVIYKNVLNGKIANVTASSNSKGIVLVFSSNNNVTGNTAYNNTMDGIFLNLSSNNNVIRNNSVSNNSNGIEVSNSVNNTLSNNNVSLNDGVGIDLVNSSNNTISTNIVSSNGQVEFRETGNGGNGIGLNQNSSNNLITGNIANSNGNKGVGIGESNQNTVQDNTANSNGMEGIYLGHSNSTLIRNNTVKSNNGTGIILQYSNNNNITGNNASNSLDYPGGDHSSGINLDNSNGNNLSNNIAASNNDTGISLDFSVNNTLINNIATSNIILGIAFRDSNSNIIRNNNVLNNQQGIVISNSVNNTLNGNNASSNNDTGIYISGSSGNNILTNNIANLNLWEGIFIEDSTNNTLTNNTASSSPNGDGIYIINSSYNTLTDNTANSNTLDGITLKNGSRNNTLTGNNASSNDYGIHFKNSSSDNTLTNNNPLNNRWDFFLEINSTNNTVTDNRGTHKGKDYAIKTASSPAPDPNGYTNIGKYVNATNNSADSWLFLNVSYSNSDVASIDESSLRMWKYNGSWSQVAGTNGVNTAQNYVYANITSFSIFAPMARTTATEYGSLNGIIKDNRLGTPLASVTVSISNTTGGTKSGTTDSNGNYYIANIVTSSTNAYIYTVTTSKTNYITNTTSVTVLNSSTNATLNINLTAYNGTLQGTYIKSGTGIGVSGATVNITNTTLGSIIRTTDSLGFYSVSLYPAIYTINVSKTGYSNSSTSATVTSNATNTTGTISLSLNTVTVTANRTVGTAANGTTVGFNLTVVNTGDNATFIVTNTSTNVTIVTKTTTPSPLVLNTSTPTGYIIVDVSNIYYGGWPVTITISNSSQSKSASITLTAIMQNTSATYTNVSSNVDANSTVTGATLVNANVQNGANVSGNSTLISNATVTGSSTVITDGAVIKGDYGNSTITNSSVGNATVDSSNLTGSTISGNATVTNSTLTSATVSNSTLTNVTVNGTSTITNVANLTNITIRGVDVTGLAAYDYEGQFQGGASAGSVEYHGINFTRIYTNVRVSQLVIEQSQAPAITPNTNTSINDTSL